MARLSVNVNKVATLRNARGKNRPNVLTESHKIIAFGAQGITVHPRPDGRHIRWPDVIELKESIQVELNVEGYPSDHFMEKIAQIRPDQCTLVPDPPDVLTSNAGWKVFGNEDQIERVLTQLDKMGVRSSLFIDPYQIEMKELLLLRDMGLGRVELYTEAYAQAFGEAHQDEVLRVYSQCAQLCHSMGLGVNAGHDLDLNNLSLFAHQIPELKEVSIGHALVCDALDMGWEKTIQSYLSCLNPKI
jgi:pyridoxine 5-phosphate synthase